jgi:uncharacterized membrane protein (UPF0127 family)
VGTRHFINLRNRATGDTLLSRVKWCASYFCRLRGLMFRSGLRAGEALLFVEASESRVATTIHMFFVPFAIAVVWLDGAGRVVDKALAQPWRPAYAPRAPARYYLETHPAFLDRVSIGDELIFEDCAPSGSPLGAAPSGR